jgi:hypothetical protein
MILRARVKALSDMPPGVPCCEGSKRRLLAFGARIIGVTPAKLKRCHCQDCGAKFMGMRVQNLRGWRIDPRAWDIAEAPEQSGVPDSATFPQSGA